jgi:hypothetical protein
MVTDQATTSGLVLAVLNTQEILSMLSEAKILEAFGGF